MNQPYEPAKKPVAPGFSSPQPRGSAAGSPDVTSRLNALAMSLRAKVAPAKPVASVGYRPKVAAAHPKEVVSHSGSKLGESDAHRFSASIDTASGKFKVAGRIKKILHDKEGFYILRLVPHGSFSKEDEVVVKGNGIDLQMDRDIVAVGYYKTEMSPQWGPQKVIDQAIVFEVVPTTRKGIQKLLENGYVKGIGEVAARRLCDAFGDRLFDIAEKEPQRLLQVTGIKRVQAMALSRTIQEKREIPRLMSFLAEVGLNIKTSHKVLKELGPGAIDLIKHNPYELTRVPSIGFTKADEVARGRGVVFDSEDRIAAALQACLENALQQGWTYLKVPELKESMAEMLSIQDPESDGKIFVDPQRLESLCEKQLIESSKVLVRSHFEDESAEHLKVFRKEKLDENPMPVVTERAISLMQYAGMERRIAKRLAALVAANVTPESRGASPSGAFFAKLSDEQQEAVRTTLASPVSIITGRPGCGKTTVTKALLDSMLDAGLKVLLVGPTNRSAKQMTDATGQRAMTIHRALGCRGFELYTHGPDNPLNFDVVIADEQSMVGTRMMDKILSAIRPGTAFVMVGDPEQLASIDAGNVLSDAIKSGVLPVSYLTQIRRTAEGSSINPNAHRVADREAPMPPNPGENEDFSMREVRSAWSKASPEAKTRSAHDQIDALIDQFHYYMSKGHKPDEIQILTPVRHKGELCANELNIVMKKMLNPIYDERLSVTTANKDARVFSVGDRVMYTANDLERDIYNGDVGYIKEIDHECNSLLIDFYDNDVEMAFTDLADLDHAYVNTVHKTQGGEFPAVIFITVSAHWNMLERQLLYTGMTRGKKDVCLLGDTHRLQSIVEKPGSEARQTMLDDELVRAFAPLKAANEARMTQAISRANSGMRPSR